MNTPDFFTLTLSDGLSDVTNALISKDGPGIEKAARKYRKLLMAVANAFRENRALAFDREDGNIEMHIYFNPKDSEL